MTRDDPSFCEKHPPFRSCDRFSDRRQIAIRRRRQNDDNTAILAEPCHDIVQLPWRTAVYWDTRPIIQDRNAIAEFIGGRTSRPARGKVDDCDGCVGTRELRCQTQSGGQHHVVRGKAGHDNTATFKLSERDPDLLPKSVTGGVDYVFAARHDGIATTKGTGNRTHAVKLALPHGKHNGRANAKAPPNARMSALLGAICSSGNDAGRSITATASPAATCRSNDCSCA